MTLNKNTCPVCETYLNDIKFDGLDLDYETNVIMVDGLPINVLPQVFEVFLYLHERFGHLLTRNELYEKIYKMSDYSDEDIPEYRNVDSAIKQLRQAFRGTKIDIETIYGSGYRLRFDTGQKTKQPLIINNSSTQETTENPFAADVLNAAAEHTVKKVQGPLRFPKELGEEPEFGIIPISEIRVDRTYQRPINLRHAKKIVAAFHWSKFQPVTLSRLPKGDFAVIDGQHRWYAARLHALVDKIPAYIINLPDIESQAETFVDVNVKRLGIDAVNIYWASLTAGKKDYIAVHELLTELKLQVAANSGINKPKTINAVGTLLEVFRRHGQDVLKQTLETLDKAFPDHANTFKSTYIRGMAEFLLTYKDELNINVLVECLSGNNPDTFNIHAKELKQSLKEISANKLFVELVRKKYNELQQKLPNFDASKFLAAKVRTGQKGTSYYRTK